MHVVETNVPVLLDVKVTVPVGTTAPVPDESATVAVQLVGVLSRTLAGAQVTVVVVARMVEARLKLPVLPEWTLSPP